MRLTPGQQAPLFTAKDIQGTSVVFEHYKNKKTLLSFFRYAGCPFCNHMFRILLAHYSQLKEKGLHVIAFFQSPKNTVIHYIEKYHAPFPVIADPKKEIYNLYQIESSLMGWPRTVPQSPVIIREIIQRKNMQGKIDGDPNLLPADFLIGPPELAIYKAYYGSHFMDKIAIEDIEEFVSSPWVT